VKPYGFAAASSSATNFLKSSRDRSGLRSGVLFTCSTLLPFLEEAGRLGAAEQRQGLDGIRLALVAVPDGRRGREKPQAASHST
jgi:hypothetical protein